MILIHPKDNKRISNESKFAKFRLIKNEFQNHIIDLTWEELYDFIENETKDSESLKTQMIEFNEKYRIKPYG